MLSTTTAIHAPSRTSDLFALPAGARSLSTLLLKLPIGCRA
ncbi:hypothetical protein [Duganella guangzhouensis]|nr:hypothetical protein [Duganella guangzhouensis]